MPTCPRVSTRKATLLAGYAARMRKQPTHSEAQLWRLLRGSRLGVRFVRQAVIGPYIVDFCCRELKLVVEVDGGYHRLRQRADARRDARLREWGYTVLRVVA